MSTESPYPVEAPADPNGNPPGQAPPPVEVPGGDVGGFVAQPNPQDEAIKKQVDDILQSDVCSPVPSGASMRRNTITRGYKEQSTTGLDLDNSTNMSIDWCIYLAEPS